MAPSHTYDVVVVGASVAGCATATFFARAGARVALVERSPEPAAYKVACTHFLFAGAMPVLDRLGVTDAMRAAGAVPISVARTLSPVALARAARAISGSRHAGPQAWAPQRRNGERTAEVPARS
jgi:2-polyprenyl-6-methoxyphenol hydroxylase-like FAD-dependent oxidoreductase